MSVCGHEVQKILYYIYSTEVGYENHQGDGKNMFERFFGGKALNSDDTNETDVLGARKLQQEGAQLVDVREPYEFESGHAKGAKNIPLGQLAQRLNEIQRDKTVLVICQSGNRSRSAQGLLRRQNTVDVRNVRGGTSAWRAAKLPME